MASQPDRSNVKLPVKTAKVTVCVTPTAPTSTKGYRSAAFAATHEAAEKLHKAGIINSTTMRKFDQDYLTPVIELSPTAIRKIHTQTSISQSIFPAHLNVTNGVVSKWERKKKYPRSPAAKLLSLAAKHGIASIA